MPAIAQVAVTETWDDFAVVSSTMGAYQGRLCAGADRGDLGCPTYAPSLTTAGDVSVTGNLSAIKFIGDGSALTGLSTTSDRITSGTSSIIVSQSGHISLTTAGTERMVINSSGNVGIGTGSPNFPLEIAKAGGGIYSKAGVTAYSSVNVAEYGPEFWLRNSKSSSIGTMTALASGDNIGTIYFSAPNLGGTVFNPSARIRVYQDGSSSSYGPGRIHLETYNRITGLNSAQLVVASNGNVGIGTTAPNSALQVSGSFTVSTSEQTTTPSFYVSSTSGYVGIGTSTPTQKLYVVDSTVGGYLGGELLGGSGKWKLGVSNNGYVELGSIGATYLRFFTGNVERMRFDTSGNVGIGTTAPGQTLDVSGTARIVSRTIIGGTATPSATLQVSGSLLLAGSDSTTCDDGHIGILRRNPTTGHLQVCK